MQATSTSAPDLADGLSGILHRKVIDQTGYAGKFDVDLKWAPDGVGPGRGNVPEPSSDLPSIFTALEENLGLKIESGKARTEVLVLDHVERPSEN